MSDRVVKVLIAVQWGDEFDPDGRIHPQAMCIVEEINPKFIESAEVELALTVALKTVLGAWLAKEMSDAS